MLLVQLLYFREQSVQEAAVTVFSTPDDGRDGCPKYVQ